MTQAQIARKLGLSRSTVAAALNPTSPVKLSENTLRLIRAEAVRSNYRPHRYAQIMRRGRSGLIGIFHFGGLYQVAAERAWHASLAIQAAGYQVLSSDASWTRAGVKAGCEAMLDARVEGVLVAGLHDPESSQELAALRLAKIPVVSLSGNALPGTPQVRVDAEDAFFRLTQHLLALGRRRLLLLFSHTRGATPSAPSWTGTERFLGFKRALQKVRAPLVETFTRARRIEARVLQSEYLPYGFDPFIFAREALSESLASSPPPDAVICSNDDWAIGAMAALRDHGLSVPRDVAVTGFDNIATGLYLDVPLTTIAQPTQAMAEKSVDLLLKKIQGRRVPIEPLKFRGDLIIRSSCGVA